MNNLCSGNKKLKKRKFYPKKLPDFLPHGWKKQVAYILNIHINTVTNAIKRGKGTTYEKIKKVAIEKWGKM